MITRKEAKKILEIDSLAPSTTSEVRFSEVLSLSKVSSVAITAQATFHASATGDVVIHILADVDGGSPDTIDFETLTLTCNAGKTVQRTVKVNKEPLFLRVTAENKDANYAATNIKVYAVLGYEE